MTNKINKTINEVIVVEGRDDTINLRRALDCLTIETHGFGIKKETWDLIQKAYDEKGIIIFTDPDFAGEEIRRKLTARFPEAKQAFIPREAATKKGDIGVENAEPCHILEALDKCHVTITEGGDSIFAIEDLFYAGLSGRDDSRIRRQKLGSALGIGYGNVKALLNKLNKFGITREEFDEALRAIDN